MRNFLTNLVAVVALSASLGFAIASRHYSHVASYEASLHVSMPPNDRPDLHPSWTVDQQIATLSTNVTMIGVMAGAAAIAVGIVTLFGYAELRTTTFRKTEEDILKIIRKLKDTGDLDAATASVLAAAIAPDKVFGTSGGTVENISTGVSLDQSSSSPEGEGSFAKRYPEGGGE